MKDYSNEYPEGVKDDIYLGNYKPPFTRTKEGYGLDGVQELHKDKQQMLCKICGEWSNSLGHHLYAHEIKARDYKDKFNLMQSTALVSEETREKLVAYGLKREPMLKKGAKIYKKRSKPRKDPNMILEGLNKEGRCYEQVLDKLVQLVDKIGRVPTADEFLKEYRIGYNTIAYRYGTYNNMLKLIGLNPNRRRFQYRYSKDVLVEHIKMFYEMHRRYPTNSDVKRGLMPALGTYNKYFGPRGIYTAIGIAKNEE